MNIINNILNWIAPAIGIGATIIGLGALLAPEQASRGFGVKASGDGEAYVRATGARDIFIGLIFLYTYWRGDRQTLALLSFITALVSGADFFITYKYGSRLFSYFHLASTMAVIGYGFWLLQ